MFTLRCTHKLLRRGLTESPHGEVAPTTLLGDWYANVVVTRLQHLVLCISERTLLPPVVPAKSAGALPARLVEALPPTLAALAIPPASLRADCEGMREHRVGRAASKRVLGSLSEQEQAGGDVGQARSSGLAPGAPEPCMASTRWTQSSGDATLTPHLQLLGVGDGAVHAAGHRRRRARL